ncbi:MAG TPA: hypothetical protein VIU64_09050 [Polyangia bacterium]
MLGGLRLFFPHAFFALPVTLMRPTPAWDEGDDSWADGEPEDMTALEEREEYGPIEGYED